MEYPIKKYYLNGGAVIEKDPETLCASGVKVVKYKKETLTIFNYVNNFEVDVTSVAIIDSTKSKPGDKVKKYTYLGYYIPDTKPIESNIYIIFSKDGSHGKDKGIPLKYWLTMPSDCKENKSDWQGNFEKAKKENIKKENVTITDILENTLGFKDDKIQEIIKARNGFENYGFNVSNDLSYIRLIVPSGTDNKIWEYNQNKEDLLKIVLQKKYNKEKDIMYKKDFTPDVLKLIKLSHENWKLYNEKRTFYYGETDSAIMKSNVEKDKLLALQYISMATFFDSPSDTITVGKYAKQYVAQRLIASIVLKMKDKIKELRKKNPGIIHKEEYELVINYILSIYNNLPITIGDTLVGKKYCRNKTYWEHGKEFEILFMNYICNLPDKGNETNVKVFSGLIVLNLKTNKEDGPVVAAFQTLKDGDVSVSVLSESIAMNDYKILRTLRTRPFPENIKAWSIDFNIFIANLKKILIKFGKVLLWPLQLVKLVLAIPMAIVGFILTWSIQTIANIVAFAIDIVKVTFKGAAILVTFFGGLTEIALRAVLCIFASIPYMLDLVDLPDVTPNIFKPLFDRAVKMKIFPTTISETDFCNAAHIISKQPKKDLDLFFTKCGINIVLVKNLMNSYIKNLLNPWDFILKFRKIETYIDANTGLLLNIKNRLTAPVSTNLPDQDEKQNMQIFLKMNKYIHDTDDLETDFFEKIYSYANNKTIKDIISKINNKKLSKSKADLESALGKLQNSTYGSVEYEIGLYYHQSIRTNLSYPQQTYKLITVTYSADKKKPTIKKDSDFPSGDKGTQIVNLMPKGRPPGTYTIGCLL